MDAILIFLGLASAPLITQIAVFIGLIALALSGISLLVGAAIGVKNLITHLINKEENQAPKNVKLQNPKKPEAYAQNINSKDLWPSIETLCKCKIIKASFSEGYELPKNFNYIFSIDEIKQVFASMPTEIQTHFKNIVSEELTQANTLALQLGAPQKNLDEVLYKAFYDADSLMKDHFLNTASIHDQACQMAKKLNMIGGQWTAEIKNPVSDNNTPNTKHTNKRPRKST